MVVKAYVLIEVEAGGTGEVVQGIRKVEGVSSADSVAGAYDVVATVEARDIDGLGGLVRQLHSIPGIFKSQITREYL